jgi:hypothetical protein
MIAITKIFLMKLFCLQVNDEAGGFIWREALFFFFSFFIYSYVHTLFGTFEQHIESKMSAKGKNANQDNFTGIFKIG